MDGVFCECLNKWAPTEDIVGEAGTVRRGCLLLFSKCLLNNTWKWEKYYLVSSRKNRNKSVFVTLLRAFAYLCRRSTIHPWGRSGLLYQELWYCPRSRVRCRVRACMPSKVHRGVVNHSRQLQTDWKGRPVLRCSCLSRPERVSRQRMQSVWYEFLSRANAFILATWCTRMPSPIQ